MNLQWDAPPGCPQRSEVLDRIRKLAGSSLDKSEELSAEGRIAEVKGRFWLTLLVREGLDVRKRVIASDSCADLAGAAAITVALLLGVDVGGLEPQSDSGALEQTPQQAAPDGRDRAAGERKERGKQERAERPDDRAERSRARSANAGTRSGSPARRRWDVVLRAPIVVADLGPLPGAILGVGLGIGMRYAVWRVLLTGHIFQEQTLTATEPPGDFGAGADVQRITGQLVTCRGWRSVQFEIAPCLGLGLEYLSARGVGEGVSPESQQAFWAALSAGGVAHWYALDYMALFVGLTGYLQLSRPRLVIEGLGEIQQLAPVAAGVLLGVEWIL